MNLNAAREAVLLNAVGNFPPRRLKPVLPNLQACATEPEEQATNCRAAASYSPFKGQGDFIERNQRH